MSVVFDFSASLNDFAPVSPILFLFMPSERKSEPLWMSFVCLLLSSRPRLSLVSVVFDFNDSLNDAVPVSPILLSVDVKRNEKSELLMDVFLCLLSFVFTTQIELSECCV